MTIAISPINNAAARDELQDKLRGDYRAIHPEAIVIPDDRLRKIDPKTIPALADSFREVGQICPIGVKRHGQNQYRVVYGARRVLAMQLLFKAAMEKATDPNTDQAVQRFSAMHAIVYRNETDDDVCRELEIRENLDRKELTHNERTAQMLLLAAAVKQRTQATKRNNGHIKVPASGSESPTLSTKIKPARKAPVRAEVASAMGITIPAVKSRINHASVISGVRLNLDQSSTEELEKAASIINVAPEPKRGSRSPSATPVPARKTSTDSVLSCSNLKPTDAPAFATWIKRRYPASFTLDQVRAFRDALVTLVQELESQA